MASSTQNILIVGGGLGIGLSITKAILESSPSTTKVLVFGFDIDPHLSLLSQTYSGRLSALLGDVTKSSDRLKAIHACTTELGGIDTLVYCAGLMGPIARMEDLDIDMAKKSYDVNVFGLMAMSQLCIPYLRKSAHLNPTNAACGKLIALSSACDKKVTYMGWMTYCTSKAALSRFIQVLANEEPTISVQGVYPKLTRTRMPVDVIAGKYQGIMADHESERFRLWSEIGDAILEPPELCGEAVAKLATGRFVGGKSGEVLYYDEHVPDYRPKL